jgi:hypothetical protein
MPYASDKKDKSGKRVAPSKKQCEETPTGRFESGQRYREYKSSKK